MIHIPRLKKLLFGILLVALFIGAVLLVRHRKSELSAMPVPETPPLQVHLQTAEPGELEISEHYLGTIEAANRITIAPRVTGHLLAVLKDVGDSVRSGDRVARLDDRTLRWQEKALQAELDGARSDLAEKKDQAARRRALFQKNHIAEESLNTAERAHQLARANIRRLEAAVESAAISIEYAKLTAPFDGVITERWLDAGDLAMAGQPVLTIEQPSAGYRVLASVPQDSAARVKPGGRANVTAGGLSLAATVYQVYPAVNPGKLATVELLQNKVPFGLPSGAMVGVDLVTGTVGGIRVSNRAILEYDGRSYVFKAKGERRVEKTEVTVLGRNKGDVVIEGAVSGGDRLVTGDESMLIRMEGATRIQSREGGM